MIPHTGRSDYHGLQMNLTKRMTSHWQASPTYTLAGLWDQDPQPISGFTECPFPVVRDLEESDRWRKAISGIGGLQRHRR